MVTTFGTRAKNSVRELIDYTTYLLTGRVIVNGVRWWE